MLRSELTQKMIAAQFAGKKEIIVKASAAGYEVISVDDSFDYLLSNAGTKVVDIFNLDKDWDEQLDQRHCFG